MLIGIHGKIGAGKDTAAEYICEKYSFENNKFAGKLKEITSLMTNCDIADCYSQEGKNKYLEDWDLTIGEFQQLLGTNAVRDNLHKDAWVLSTFSSFNYDTDNWVISDVRFPNEANKIKALDGLLIKIERNVTIDHNRNNTHESETALDNYTGWDYIIQNNDTIQTLYKNIDDVITSRWAL